MSDRNEEARPPESGATAAILHFPDDNVFAGDWKDVNGEAWREYLYPDGFTLRIDHPVTVLVSDSHSHRVISYDPDSGRFTQFYVPAGWRMLTWQSYDGRPLYLF